MSSANVHDEASRAETSELELRVNEHQALMEAQVASGQRAPESLFVVAKALRGATPEFPARRYPTSAGAWRK